MICIVARYVWCHMRDALAPPGMMHAVLPWFTFIKTQGSICMHLCGNIYNGIVYIYICTLICFYMHMYPICVYHTLYAYSCIWTNISISICREIPSLTHTHTHVIFTRSAVRPVVGMWPFFGPRFGCRPSHQEGNWLNWSAGYDITVNGLNGMNCYFESHWY